MQNKTCCSCDVEMNVFSISAHESYCRACWAKSMRDTYDSPIGKKKQDARTKARRYLLKGIIIKENCRLCGSDNAQMHHPDYNKPTDVAWLCAPCHNQYHALERRVYAAR